MPDIWMTPDDAGTTARGIQQNKIKRLLIPPGIAIEKIGRHYFCGQPQAGQVLLNCLAARGQVQGGERADWLTETYLVPMYRAVLAVLENVQDSEGSKRRFGSHMIPSIFGAIIFPFIDAGTVSAAFKTEVFSEDYIAEQADYVEMLIRASMPAGSSK